MSPEERAELRRLLAAGFEDRLPLEADLPKGRNQCDGWRLHPHDDGFAVAEGMDEHEARALAAAINVLPSLLDAFDAAEALVCELEAEHAGCADAAEERAYEFLDAHRKTVEDPLRQELAALRARAELACTLEEAVLRWYATDTMATLQDWARHEIAACRAAREAERKKDIEPEPCACHGEIYCEDDK